SLEYERILSASGPTHGHVVRPSDGREVSTLTFVQCVGSRSVKNVPYCSKICCMYTTKQAIITKEHLKDVQIRILYNDLRASGKGFYEFIERGRSNEYNIQYIKGLPGKISEDPITKNILITFEDMSNHSFQEIECDLVVLAPAMIPNPDLVKLARILELELDEHGFVKTPYFNAHATSQSGIFVIGTASGPKDIPESVAEASGCAALATKSSVTKITPSVGEEPLEEKDVKSPRIGIFACHCGSNIGGIVNIPEVVEYARTLPNVVFSMDNLYTCSEDSQKIIQEKIKEHDLTRVIVASCTPSTHEPLFRKTCQEAGLNPYLFDLANIREQCSWVHMREPEKATEKAKDIIRMYAARVLDSEPLNKIKNSIIPEVLVIGGGIAGMEAAHTISSHGFRVHLFEKSNELGGMLKNLSNLHPIAGTSDDLLEYYAKIIERDDLIQVHLNTTIQEVSGSIGNFHVDYSSESENGIIEVGAIIVATGGEVNKPEGKYLYGENPNILTLLDLELKLKNDELQDFSRIGIIHCVGSRNPEDHSYCSTICCTVSLKNIISLKERLPNCEITSLYQDMCVFNKDEELYRNARSLANFVQYEKEDDIKVIARDDGLLEIEVNNIFSGEPVKFKVNKLILATPIIPSSTSPALSQILKVPRAYNGFFLEAHVKHRPLDFASDGIFLCGTCQSPNFIRETVSQARGAAGRALIPLLKGEIESEAVIAEVDVEKCIGCEICKINCPYGAITCRMSG
ncbi:MAG: FAD-dependent oxidoreductase, partial [Candidatus Helarchaeota archaeon]